MSRFDLIIWDCDGCLIDSELLSCGSAASLLRDLGYEISTQAFVERFMGCRANDIFDALEQETGRDFRPFLTFEVAEAARRKLFDAELKPLPFVLEAIEQIGLPVCIASGSEPERLSYSLRLTGLWKRFEGRVYSAHEVERGKPAPDIFLYAAAKCGVSPDRCLVIEDGVHGIHAAHAAGMCVFAFGGASHMNDSLVAKVKALQPHAYFDDMRELPALVAGWGRG